MKEYIFNVIHPAAPSGSTLSTFLSTYYSILLTFAYIMMFPPRGTWLYIVSLSLLGMASSMNSSVSEFGILNEVYDNLPHENCDVILISSKPLQGERLELS